MLSSSTVIVHSTSIWITVMLVLSCKAYSDIRVVFPIIRFVRNTRSRFLMMLMMKMLMMISRDFHHYLFSILFQSHRQLMAAISVDVLFLFFNGVCWRRPYLCIGLSCREVWAFMNKLDINVPELMKCSLYRFWISYLKVSKVTLKQSKALQCSTFNDISPKFINFILWATLTEMGLGANVFVNPFPNSNRTKTRYPPLLIGNVVDLSKWSTNAQRRV